jgi:hypothetical protein
MICSSNLLRLEINQGRIQADAANICRVSQRELQSLGKMACN